MSAALLRTARKLMDGIVFGIRGVRFNFLKRLVDHAPKDKFLDIARRIGRIIASQDDVGGWPDLTG